MEIYRHDDFGRQRQKHSVKYGFVYLWYDRKHKRYYIGCHWGHEDDGYICSSRWMRKSYNRRPNDFKRRIVSRTYTNRKDLFEEEYRWLCMIKPEELRKRYYNISKKHFGHWSTDPHASLSILEKSKINQKKAYAAMTSEERKAKFGYWKGKTNTNKGKTYVELHGPEKAAELLEKNRLQATGRKYSVEINKKKGRPPWNKGIDLKEAGYDTSKFGWSKGRKLQPRTNEVKEKIGKKNSSNMKALWQNPEYRQKMLQARSK